MNDAPRRNSRFIVLGLLALGLVGLVVLRMTVFQPMADQARKEADKQAILKVLTDQDAAWNRGDLEAFMEGYWHSPDLTFYSGGDVRQGWDETIDRYRKRYQAEGKEMGHLTFSDLQIDLLGPDDAVVRGKWQVEMTKETLGGLFTLVMRRFPEGWRIVHDHTSAPQG